MEPSAVTSALTIDLQRIARVTVGAKVRAALGELIKAGRQLEGLSSQGHSQWAIEPDPAQRATLANTVNALQSLATDCWRVVLDLRTLDEGLVALNQCPTTSRPGLRRLVWPFPTSSKDEEPQ
jgi:hypothetical protein